MKAKINIVAIQSNVSKDFDISINNLLKKTPDTKFDIYGQFIENPILGDRLSLLYKLSYTQWSVEEIIEGKPLKHLL